jgi:hypothetical protein
MTVSRRTFLHWLAGVPLLGALPFRTAAAAAPGPIPVPGDRTASIGQYFKGEELAYQVGFWVFKRAAVGTLSFKETEKKGQYMAVLQGETLGVLGWVARYRTDTYRAVMEETEDGTRLRSLSFEEDVKVGTSLRRRTHFFDHPNRKWIQVKRNKNGSLSREEEPIPLGMIYDDFITASYNFRYGVYGAPERGRKYSIPTFPKKGPNRYEVRILSKEEEAKKRRPEKARNGKEYYIQLLLDADLTHSKDGLIEGWLSKDLYPIEGRIRDVVLFGDVYGTLVRSSRT